MELPSSATMGPFVASKLVQAMPVKAMDGSSSSRSTSTGSSPTERLTQCSPSFGMPAFDSAEGVGTQAFTSPKFWLEAATSDSLAGRSEFDFPAPLLVRENFDSFGVGAPPGLEHPGSEEPQDGEYVSRGARRSLRRSLNEGNVLPTMDYTVPSALPEFEYSPPRVFKNTVPDAAIQQAEASRARQRRQEFKKLQFSQEEEITNGRQTHSCHASCVCVPAGVSGQACDSAVQKTLRSTSQPARPAMSSRLPPSPSSLWPGTVRLRRCPLWCRRRHATLQHSVKAGYQFLSSRS
ncbi:unnamed protein product [Polarella glacialis]|uniref:Uncharacterized protein n=1 Tax=Polarella glacialis TaxID=89957 RepID=A0A813GMY3_POLGL|nr:unnamed protein product [Polarella glacialis]